MPRGRADDGMEEPIPRLRERAKRAIIMGPGLALARGDAASTPGALGPDSKTQSKAVSRALHAR
eukprot:14556871-Alexandrium_andersonii.AAC.1